MREVRGYAVKRTDQGLDRSKLIRIVVLIAARVVFVARRPVLVVLLGRMAPIPSTIFA